MRQVTLEEAVLCLSELIEKAGHGEEITLTREGHQKERIIQEELAFLKELEREADATWNAPTRPPFRLEDITITHAIPVDPATCQNRVDIGTIS